MKKWISRKKHLLIIGSGGLLTIFGFQNCQRTNGLLTNSTVVTNMVPQTKAAVVSTTNRLDSILADQLRVAGFTGGTQASLVKNLGRPINTNLASLGQVLFFDSILSLGNDNSCSGCHSPMNGFGDSQSMSIGVDNNGLVGPGRTGPRNQRRAPLVINAAFYPSLMWNTRISAISRNAFDTSLGVEVPFFIGGTTVWRPGAATIHGTLFDNNISKTLLSVHANFPPTETVEVAGNAVVDPQNFDSRIYYPPHLTSSGLISDTVPAAIAGPNGSSVDSIDRGYAIRSKVLDRINKVPNYVSKFAALFPSAANGNINFAQIGAAIAEFEFTLAFADAPLDQFARGNTAAMTLAQKRGASLFFGKANCISCHSVSGESREMFSDFKNHVIGVPQIAPASFGLRPGGNPRNTADLAGNFEFSGLANNEDYGREEITGNPLDRYAFRSAPLRNLAVQAAFFHNGAFTSLREAMAYHMNPRVLGPKYSSVNAGLAADLTVRLGPIAPVLNKLDPKIDTLSKVDLSLQDFDDIYQFVSGGLLDSRALATNTIKSIPVTVPSGRKILTFLQTKPRP